MRYDAIVIGGGIVGLATAFQTLSKKPGLKLLLLEKESRLSAHQTGNNSGVIHSGLYYKPGSLKARNCINGYQMLLNFCDQEEIPYELCGKVVVATEEEQKPLLENLYNRGLENGLDQISKISIAELKEIEPHVNGIAALKVPYTGIIDYTRVADKYGEKIKELGGDIRLGTKVLTVKEGPQISTVVTTQGDFETTLILNCAGLYSDKMARQTSDEVDLKIIPFRGEYFKLVPEKEYLVKHLIYPVPDPNFPFLGVHFTRMMKGGIEAGPNAVLAFRREGYKKSQIHLGELAESLMWPGFQKVAMKYWKTGMGEMYRSFSKAAFTKALQKLIPEIESKDLVDGGAGVRAQACDRTGGLLDDFAIIEARHAINVCNAPSPAATSSLSIGDTVSDLAVKRFS
ncbi:MAG: L-2-hydroxyglutarate oxidase [Roseivirga sp.]